MPGKRITSSVIQSIHLLAHTLLKANGEPNQNAIAKQLGIAPNSVKRHLTVYAEKTVELQPSMQQIDEANGVLWQTTKRDVIPALTRAMQHTAERFEESAKDKDTDARDLRHLAAAADQSYKTVSLASGDVTSRTQANQTNETTVKHEVIRVPEKDTAAFQVQDGLRGELPPTYDVSDTDGATETPMDAPSGRVDAPRGLLPAIASDTEPIG